MEIPNEREFQKIPVNHSSEIKFKDFRKLCKDYTKEQFSFLLSDTTFPLDSSLKFRKNLLLNDC